jgi:hypothetical protein
MANKTTRICTTLLPLLLILSTIVYSEKLRIFGRNTLSYWQWDDTTGATYHFAEDILTLNALYGNFRGNVEFYLYEPSDLTSSIRKEGIRKRFLEYKSPQWSIRGGNFHSSLGRGLIINQSNETVGNIERDIDGIFFRYSYNLFTVSVLSGKPKNIHFVNKKYYVVNDTTDILQGGELRLDLLPFFPLSAGAIRLSRDNPGENEPRTTYIYGLNGELAKGPLIIYGEVAQKDGWDNILYTESKGIGLYGALTLFVKNISASFEYLHYDSIGYGGSTIYRYNAPPTGNLDSYSINRASDEKGWMLDITSNPFGNWYIELNKSILSCISNDSISFEEMYAEIRGEFKEKGPSFLTSLKNLEYKSPEPMIDLKTEWIPHLEVKSSLGPHSLKVGINSRMVEIDTVSFVDNAALVDIGIFSYLSLSGRWEIRDKEILLESEGTDWKVFEMRWDLSESHTLSIMAGSEKGGLICTGGVCRIEEPFEGVKINLLSRF